MSDDKARKEVIAALEARKVSTKDIRVMLEKAYGIPAAKANGIIKQERNRLGIEGRAYR